MTDEQQQTDDMNKEVIEEFRANAGAVNRAVRGFFGGKPLLILHTTGAKTGKVRLNPLVYAIHDGNHVVAATKGGAPKHPHWFLNLRANPVVTVEVGRDQFPATAIIVDDGPLRDELYGKFVGIMPDQYSQYQAMTDRRIPVVVLRRVS